MFADDDDGETDSSAQPYSCMPSLVTLQQMRNRINLAETGKKLMKWTAMATGRELRTVAKKLHEVYTSYREEMSYGYVLLARSRYNNPYLNVIVLENVKPEADIFVERNYKSVSGVKTARVVFLESEHDSYPYLGIGRGGEIILDTKQYWRSILKNLTLIYELRSNFVDLEIEFRNATKKKQLISRVVLPRLNSTVRYIKSELEEKEREDTFRLKRFKQLKTKKQSKHKNKTKCCPLCTRPIPATREGGDRRTNDSLCECAKVPSRESIDSRIQNSQSELPFRTPSSESCSRPKTPHEKPSCECTECTDPSCECIIIDPPCECKNTTLKQKLGSGSPSCECIIHPSYCTPSRQLSLAKIARSNKTCVSPKSVCSLCESYINATASKTSFCPQTASAPCVTTKNVPTPRNVCSPCESSKRMVAPPRISSNTSVKFVCDHKTPSTKKSVCKQETPSKSSVKSVCKQCEEQSKGKTDELGTFETTFKEIVKVIRTKNCDGSISETKEVTTIRTETRNPNKSLDVLNRKSERSFTSNRSENKGRQMKSTQTSCSGLKEEPKIPSCALSTRSIPNRHRTPCSGGSYDDLKSTSSCLGCCVTSLGTMTERNTDRNRMHGSASSSGGKKGTKSKSCCGFSTIENVPLCKQKLTSSCSRGFNTVATDAATRDAGANCTCLSEKKSLNQKKCFPSYSCTSCPSMSTQTHLDKTPKKSKSCSNNATDVTKTLKNLRMSPSLIEDLKTFFRSGNKHNIPEDTESMEKLERSKKSNGCQATAESDDEIEINQCDPCEYITMKSCQDIGIDAGVKDRKCEISHGKSVVYDGVKSDPGVNFKPNTSYNSNTKDASTNTRRSTRYDVRKVASAPTRTHIKKKSTGDCGLMSCKCQSEFTINTIFPTVRIRPPNIFQTFNFSSWY